MQSLATLRISELFDMIKDYPDSLPALTDLKECLTHTHQHADAVAVLAEAIDSRLLKPGADTANIIQVYVSAIRALRQLDPTGVTLEAVSDRVRTYLKARSDTSKSARAPSAAPFQLGPLRPLSCHPLSSRSSPHLSFSRPPSPILTHSRPLSPILAHSRHLLDCTVRQIVTSLTDPETSELLEPSDTAGGEGGEPEVLKDEGGGIDAEMCDLDLDDLKGDEAAMLEWTPDPVQADPSRSSSRRTADVLSILVNIYGSKALFVNEFRSMLADKLLNASDYETDKEVRNLELLKKRFGEAALSSCETMLRDIADSKRVTRAIQRHFGDDEAKVVDATIVSRLCWPTLATESFALPERMERELARFEKQFMHHKAPRKLVWKPTLGTVTIDVAFADKTIKAVKCSPLHATILVTFGEQPKWTLSALSKKLKVDSETLKKRMVMWINRGFIHEAGRTADGDIVPRRHPPRLGRRGPRADGGGGRGREWRRRGGSAARAGDARLRAVRCRHAHQPRHPAARPHPQHAPDVRPGAGRRPRVRSVGAGAAALPQSAGGGRQARDEPGPVQDQKERLSSTPGHVTKIRETSDNDRCPESPLFVGLLRVIASEPASGTGRPESVVISFDWSLDFGPSFACDVCAHPGRAYLPNTFR